ncbi:MAG: hypothetical protein HYZ73_05130 [Elusimicrobia bacterium]|nr:hypothetical protein [Elusimicrobiota bacterium]
MSDEGANEWEENYNAVAERRCNMEGQESTAVEIRDWLLKQGLAEAQIRQEFLQVNEEGVCRAKAEIKELDVKVALELEQAALLASLPASGHELDKIIRYEASLDRQLYKAINQLERLQRRRKGETLPVPIVLEEN